MSIVLASTSTIRRQILEHAGIAFETARPMADEDEIKRKSEHLDPGELAVVLAEAKALSVSSKYPEKTVIGGDQVLNLEGKALGKPANVVDAEAQLRSMRGRSHRLETAICCAIDGAIIWRHLARPALSVRDFSDEFLKSYLARAGDRVKLSAGSYQLESFGVQLFDAIDGDYFAILGLPLLPLLSFLRSRGMVAA